MRQNADSTLNRRQFLAQTGSVVTSFAILDHSGLLQAAQAAASWHFRRCRTVRARWHRRFPKTQSHFTTGSIIRPTSTMPSSWSPGRSTRECRWKRSLEKPRERRTWRAFSIIRPGVQSHLLLEQHEARWRRQAAGRIGEAIAQSFGDYQKFVEASLPRPRRSWQRLGLAGAGREQTPHDQDSQCR